VAERKWASEAEIEAFFAGDPPPLPKRTPPASARTTAPTPEPMGTVIAPTGSGKFETVANGFGGTTTRRRATTAAASPSRPPSAASVSYLKDLLRQLKGNPAAEAVRDALNIAREAGELTQATVSQSIDALKRIKENA
jgi:hypothetical protein